jgi:hypothetical protein
MLGLGKEMPIGTAYELNPLLLGVGDHLVALEIEKGLSPIIEEDKEKVLTDFINNFFKEIEIHISRGSVHTRGNRTKWTT